MQNKKKLITALLAAAVVVSQCAAPNMAAFAGMEETSGTEAVQEVSSDSVKLATATTGTTDDGFKYSISGDEATITGYSGSDRDITIPSTAGGKPVTAIGDSAFYNKNITSITIPDGVTAIGNSAFELSSIQSVTIPNGVTSIGDGAFYNCRSLTGVTIPDSMTDIETYAFVGCMGLTSAKIGKNVENIGSNAFASCGKLTSITLKAKVKTIGKEAFEGSGLKSIKIKSKKLISVGTDAFRYIDASAKIKVPSSKLSTYKQLLRASGYTGKIKSL